jgi:hemolysin activation/secretion protein
MQSKINCFLFISCLYISFLDQEATKAQLPPRIDRPVQPNIILPEPPTEPKLEIRNRDESPRVDEFPNLVVKQFRFINNTVISELELQSIVAPYIGKGISMLDIYAIRDTISTLYKNKGYITSGVSILIEDNPLIDLNAATLSIRLNEGLLENIQINGTKRLARYIRNRIYVKNKVLKSTDLQKALRLLEDDPLIKKIDANLSPAEPLNRSNLDLTVTPSNPFQISLFANNYRNCNVGCFERGVEFIARNPSTLGDTLLFTYVNSNGSDSIQASYSLPLNAQNTALKLQYSYGNNSVISFPASILEIKGRSQNFQIGIRHPLMRLADEKSRFDLGIGLGLEYFEIKNSLLGFDFPVSRGADNNGLTKLSVLSLVQDATYKDTIQIASLKTELRLGVDLDSSTGPGFKKDGFVILRTQGSWTRKLPFNTFFGIKLGGQYAETPLVGSEQFSLGGISSIPGYPQDTALTDSGVFGGISFTKALSLGKRSQLALTSFFNVGYGSNNGSFDDPPVLLAAPGVQISYEFNQKLFADLTYAIPIFDLGQNRSNLQGNGLSLSIRYVF